MYDTGRMTRARATALLFGGAALGATGLRAAAQTMTPLRVALYATENAAEPDYAKEMGFFAKAGLDVDIQTLNSSAAVAAAISSNAVDIGFVTIDVAAAIHQRNIPLVVIAPAAEYVSPGSMRTSALILPGNSPVQQAKDLNGKIIAASALHSLAETAPRSWIDQNGGDSATIKFVELPFPAMPAALDSGRIDAAWVTEPFLGVARAHGRVLTYGFDGISKHFLIGAWFATPQWAQDHPDVAKRYAGVIHDTAVWANKNQSRTGEILATYLKIDPAVIATMARTHYAEAVTPALLQPLIDVSSKYNGFAAFPAQELMSPSAR